MNKTWREHAAPIIQKVLQENKGEDEGRIRRALFDAYPYGQREHHPYKIWLDEIKRQRGFKPPLGTGGRKPQPMDPNQIKLL